MVTEKDLREIAETFPEVKKAPVSLSGHWLDPSRPRLGNVVGVTYDEQTQTLLGTIEEQDELAEAVDKGYFPDVSIGAKRRAIDGKMYLHHVAYLGEEPPAIKDLLNNIQNTLQPDVVSASDKDPVILFPSVLTTRLELSDSSKQGGGSMTMEQALSELEAEKKKTAALTKEATQLNEKMKEISKLYPDIALSDPDPKVQVLLDQLRTAKKEELVKASEGKVPKAKQTLLLALADHLPLGRSVELSDGETKRSVGIFDLLKEMLEAIPLPVQEGRLSLSDPTGNMKPLDHSKLFSHV